VNKKPYQCNDCDRRFKTRRGLQIHAARHRKEIEAKAREEALANLSHADIRSDQAKRYAALVLGGAGKMQALVEAGYSPGSKRAGQAMIKRLEDSLASKGVLVNCLIEAGVNPLMLSERLVKSIASKDDRVALAAIGLIFRVLGYDQPSKEQSKGADEFGIPREARQKIREQLLPIIERGGSKRSN